MKDPPHAVRYMIFQTATSSLGLGLGGSAAINFVLGFNIETRDDLEEAGLESGIDFAADFAISGTAGALRTIPNYLEFFYEFESGWKKYLFLGGKGLSFAEKHEKLKSCAEKAYANSGRYECLQGRKSRLAERAARHRTATFGQIQMHRAGRDQFRHRQHRLSGAQVIS